MVRVNFPYFMDREAVDYIIKAVVMVAKNGWKLLSQVRNLHKIVFRVSGMSVKYIVSLYHYFQYGLIKSFIIKFCSTRWTSVLDRSRTYTLIVLKESSCTPSPTPQEL